MRIFNWFAGKKEKIIIGIHGLDNKPPEKILRRWWIRSIKDGLRRKGINDLSFHFELTYWADILHPHPLRRKTKDKNSPLYLNDPYVPLEKTQAAKTSSGILRKKLLDLFEYVLDNLYFSRRFASRLVSWSSNFVKKRFNDLYVYFSDAQVIEGYEIVLTRKAIQNRLLKLLKKHRHDDILLIAHSMGSIIAYDVLTTSEFKLRIHTFVTIGSPLGLPLIMERIAKEHKFNLDDKHRLRVPETVGCCWYNLADLRDNVTINYTLADDFAPNSKGVKIVDVTVKNEYEINGQKNPHKAYGYLQTEQMAEIVSNFLRPESGNDESR
ncbi:MAG TPA: alpha/beta hydrolase [Caldithrix abyssi]|uniref:Alpha/beta hydrolase n=1 Tax=Caldithrix abyssi TaxID=187145 RepID=A0A7V4U3U2_CALAY|nr:alpha/beta hydrolase [Caldithrix abyssi]